MRKFYLFLAILLTAMTVQAKGNGIPSEIFKNGKAKYEKSTNTLVLEDGFKYSLGKGLVVFDTGKDLRLLLKGNAELKAALVFKDNLIIEASQPANSARRSPMSFISPSAPSTPIRPISSTNSGSHLPSRWSASPSSTASSNPNP